MAVMLSPRKSQLSCTPFETSWMSMLIMAVPLVFSSTPVRWKRIQLQPSKSTTCCRELSVFPATVSTTTHPSSG